MLRILKHIFYFSDFIALDDFEAISPGVLKYTRGMPGYYSLSWRILEVKNNFAKSYGYWYHRGQPREKQNKWGKQTMKNPRRIEISPFV